MSGSVGAFTGCVKWFNAKGGFGFITHDGVDVFVHHSALVTALNQFRYLVQGEYVTFDVVDVEGSDGSQEKKQTAANVRGIGGGKLMCEVRQETRDAYVSHKAVSGGVPARGGARVEVAPRRVYRGTGGSEVNEGARGGVRPLRGGRGGARRQQ